MLSALSQAGSAASFTLPRPQNFPSPRRISTAPTSAFDASGVVGSALLTQLPADQVICLTHRKPVSVRDMETVRGNIEDQRFGLAEDAFRALASRIGCVVHAAAATKFSQPAANINRTNIDGTRHVLELAQAAGVPLYFVSTAFVHPVRDPSGAAASNAYEASKRSAEEIIGSSG